MVVYWLEIQLQIYAFDPHTQAIMQIKAMTTERGVVGRSGEQRAKYPSGYNAHYDVIRTAYH